MASRKSGEKRTGLEFQIKGKKGLELGKIEKKGEKEKRENFYLLRCKQNLNYYLLPFFYFLIFCTVCYSLRVVSIRITILRFIVILPSDSRILPFKPQFYTNVRSKPLLK